MFDMFDRSVHAFGEGLLTHGTYAKPHDDMGHNLGPATTICVTPRGCTAAWDVDYNGGGCLIPDRRRKGNRSVPASVLKWDDAEYGLRAKAADFYCVLPRRGRVARVLDR